MKTSFKILILSGVLGLSGCAVTNSLLQHAYDEQAESDCSSAYTNANSIHVPQSCRTINNEASKFRFKDEKAKEKKDGE